MYIWCFYHEKVLKISVFNFTNFILKDMYISSFLRYIWHRINKILGTSHAEIEWEIPEGTPPGDYRLHHFGNYKYILGGIYPYHGFSDTFKVT